MPNIQQSAGIASGTRSNNFAIRRFFTGATEAVVTVTTAVSVSVAVAASVSVSVSVETTRDVVVEVVELPTRVVVTVAIVELRSLVCWIVRIFVMEMLAVEVENEVTVFVAVAGVTVDVDLQLEVEILLLASK
jgi:hypothetical protein